MVLKEGEAFVKGSFTWKCEGKVSSSGLKRRVVSGQGFIYLDREGKILQSVF